MTWSLSGDSPWTWYLHAAVAVFSPALLAWPDWLVGGEVPAFSLAMLLGFIVRERVDRRRKIKAGKWNDKWKRDRAGDLLGPTTATACYSLAWMVYT